MEKNLNAVFLLIVDCNLWVMDFLMDADFQVEIVALMGYRRDEIAPVPVIVSKDLTCIDNYNDIACVVG